MKNSIYMQIVSNPVLKLCSTKMVKNRIPKNGNTLQTPLFAFNYKNFGFIVHFCRENRGCSNWTICTYNKLNKYYLKIYSDLKIQLNKNGLMIIVFHMRLIFIQQQCWILLNRCWFVQKLIQRLQIANQFGVGKNCDIPLRFLNLVPSIG